MKSQQPLHTSIFQKAKGILNHEKQKKPVKQPIPVEEEKVFKAVYPIINETAFPRMMGLYRVYVSRYNKFVERENALIAIHNEQVKRYLSEEATELEKAYARNFPLLNKKLTKVREYNKAAEDACLKYGPVVTMKKVQKLKYQTEQFYQNFLHVYNCQLANVNKEFIRLGNRTPRPIRPLKVNSYFVTKLKRAEDVLSLNVCSKTVRNHRQRLEEAGVFVNSTFKGVKNPVEVEINPDLLVVWDDFTQKLTRPDNQSLSEFTGKKLPKDDDTTRPLLKEYKEKNEDESSFEDKESLPATIFSHYKNNFYRNTGGNQQKENSPGAAPAENSKKNIASELRDYILHPQELAEQLSRGEYDEYVPIPLNKLKHLAYKGAITNEDYRELVIQDLLKQSAKIWKDKTVFVGSWKNAYNHWMQYKFKAFTGHSMTAANVFSYIEEYRYRLEQARRWYARPKVEVQPLFPSDYFDTSRKSTKEIGFEGTTKMWQRKQQYDEKKSERELTRKKKAEARAKRIADTTKLNKELNRYIRNRITLLELVEYVKKNLPHEFYQKLPELMKAKIANPPTAGEIFRL